MLFVIYACVIISYNENIKIAEHMALTDKIKEIWSNLSELTQKLILGTVFVAVSIFLAWLMYRIFFAPSISLPPKQIPAPEETGRLPEDTSGREGTPSLPSRGTGALPIEAESVQSRIVPAPIDEVAKGGVTKTNLITPRPVLAPTFASDQRGFHYYDPITGKFYRIPVTGGAPQPLSAKEFQGVSKVTWSAEGNRSIIEFQDGANILYNFVTDRQVTLPKEAQDFDFSERGSKIAYEFVTENPDKNFIVVSDDDGRNARAVEELSPDPDDMQVLWAPSEQFVALFRKGSDINSQNIFFIGQNLENFKKLETKGRGFKGKWSPLGNKLLYSEYLEEELFRPSLFIANALPDTIGTDNKALDVPTTVDKCVFDQDNITVYCAVPLYLPQASGQYPELLEGIPDEIYQINTRTGLKRKLAEMVTASGVGNFSVQSILLDHDGKTLYVLDDSNLLRSLKIKE